MVHLSPAPRGTGVISALVSKKALMMADTDIYDCCTSTRGFTDTLSNFAISKTYSYLTPKLWKETVLTKSPYQEFTDRLVKTCSSVSLCSGDPGSSCGHYLRFFFLRFIYLLCIQCSVCMYACMPEQDANGVHHHGVAGT